MGVEKKYVIVNDTSVTGHFGCKLVMETLHRYLNVIGTVPLGVSWSYHRDLLDQADLVVVNGEGTTHHGRGQDLIRVAGSYPSVLINCVWQDMPYIDGLKDFLYVSVREGLSAYAMDEQGVMPKVVPDLMFDSDVGRPRREQLVVMDSAGRRVKGAISPYDPTFIEEARKAHSICSGRFHGVCLAMMWGIPFSAYPSNTHKIEGMMMDAGCLHLFRDSHEAALGAIGLFDAEPYVSQARQEIAQMFDEIKAI